MSRLDSNSPTPGADSSLELVMTAAAAQRSNRPRHYLVFASIVLLAAVGYLVWIITAQGAAAARLRKARTDLNNLRLAVDQVKVTLDPATRELYDANPRVINQLTTIAEQEGLPNVVPSSANDIRTIKGYVIKQYSVSISEKDPAVLLKWLQRVTNDTEIPGLDLSRVKLTPGFKLPSEVVGWNLEATFQRWQREN